MAKAVISSPLLNVQTKPCPSCKSGNDNLEILFRMLDAARALPQFPVEIFISFFSIFGRHFQSKARIGCRCTGSDKGLFGIAEYGGITAAAIVVGTATVLPVSGWIRRHYCVASVQRLVITARALRPGYGNQGVCRRRIYRPYEYLLLRTS